MVEAIRFYIPGDAAAVALGADELAAELNSQLAQRGLHSEVVRNGTRGMIWLEPLLEVDWGQGRHAYGPVDSAALAEILEHCLDNGPPPTVYLGETEALPWLRAQQRLTFARTGLIDPLSLKDYLAHEGFIGLQKATAMEPQAIVESVVESGLRGRGGAAFPTGIKWQTVLDASAGQAGKYIVCNADEGDSGTFADRILMEGDPFSLIEGMAIAGLAVGADTGYIYLRSEYPHAAQTLKRAIGLAREAGYLGDSVAGSGKTFDLKLRIGAGAYICGEETSLLDSLEGKRGMIRAKPPLPAIEGLFGQPTVVNNVITLASVPVILAKGAEYYKNFGTGRSRGTIPVQLAGNVLRGGLLELAFGMSIRELLDTFAGGTASGRPARAMQIGGPLGAYLPPTQWDTPLDYEALAERGAMLGHGGVVVFDDSVDMAEQAEFAMQFCAVESCGKCTPCRIGSVRGVETLQKIRRDENRAENLLLLNELCETMRDASLCAMGGLTPFPVTSAIQHFPEDFGVEDNNA